MIRKIAVIGFCTLFVVGCGQDEEQTAPTETPTDGGQQAGDTSALFERIDADTAWLIANLETVPDELSTKLWSSLQAMSDLNEQTYTDVADEIDDAPMVSAALRELAQIDSEEAFAERGLEPNGHWALHAVSLYPFVHWELSDPEAFRATLERIAADAGTELNWRDVQDTQVLWAPMEEMGLALAYDDRFATFAVIPDNAALLRRVANLDQPANAYDPEVLAEFGESRGYTPYASGFVEFERVVGQLLDGDDTMLTAARESTSLGEIAGNEACRTELGALVDLFPRISLGYTDMSRESMAFDMTVEAQPEFAERMRVIADTPVDLTKSRSDLLEFGLALNIVGARDFAREIVAGWVEAPPQCELFATIRDKAEDWQLALNQPIPPVVTNFHGMRLNLQSLTMGENMNVDAAEGSLALFMRNPQMMLGMAQMFSPELAAMPLEPGGEPQPVPKGVIPNLPAGIPAFVGLGEAAIGLAVGEAQKDQLGEAMDPGEGGDAILSYGIDFEAYGETMGTMMADMQERMAAMSDGEDNPMGTQDPSETFKAMAELYDYTRASMHLTERGIEFRSTVTLN